MNIRKLQKRPQMWPRKCVLKVNLKLLVAIFVALGCLMISLVLEIGEKAGRGNHEFPALKSGLQPGILSLGEKNNLGGLEIPAFKSGSNSETLTIAYAISLVKCGDHQSTASGLTDAALVLRHSIHLTHLKSKYKYKMYAIVHKQAEACSQILRDVGFEIELVFQPVATHEIRGDYLRANIHREWCCGHSEFIKLYAYRLPHPVIVHVDIDFAFFKTMDDLFDAILYDKESPTGRAARAKIPLERPEAGYPDKIDAFVTRDWPQVRPGRKPGYQAGFLVARRDPTVVDEVVEIIREGNFTAGFGRDNGWGGGGYGGFVGAMAMQGLMAYYYDMVRPNTAVELNQCRYNHMGMNVLYTSYPNFSKNHPKRGRCRNDRDYCEDCRNTSFSLIYNVHYTQCKCWKLLCP